MASGPDATLPVEEVDVIIVGSGPAGSTYARVIGDARPDASILMVEVGPRLTEALGEHTANVPEAERVVAQMLAQGPDADNAHVSQSISLGKADGTTFSVPGLFLVGKHAALEGEDGLPAASMSSGVGGMGVHWAGLCPRPSGAERVPFIPNDELDALLDVGDDLLSVSKDLHAGDALVTKLRDAVSAEFDRDAPDGAPVGFMPQASQRIGSKIRRSGTSSILGDLASRVPGFELRHDSLVRRVLIKRGAAVGAELVDRRDGRRYTVRARRVVVCADSLRTPQLLFASGVRPKSLGHYLNDQLQIFGVARLRDEWVAEPARTRSAPVVSYVLIPYITDVRPMQGGIVLKPKGGSGPAVGEGLQASEAMLPWWGAKDVRFGDAVEFSETEHDFYGMPAMTIHYRLTDTDRHTIERMQANIARAAALVGELLTEPTLTPPGSSLHYQGTVRMGVSDDGESVCDPYGRVWGTDHLYVGGNGVIPTATACNPTLTNVALAVRAGRELARTL